MAKRKSYHYIRSELGYSPLHQAKQLAIILASALFLHTSAMTWLEGLPLEDAVWLTMSTATTVGYGDLAPKTVEGRLATILLIYLGGILMAARIGVLYFDYLLERRMKIIRGKWQWKLEDHLVFINAPEEGAANYFESVAQDLRSSPCEFADVPIVIHSSQFEDGMPEPLRELGVAHVHSDTITDESLAKAGVQQAKIIIILAKKSNALETDSIAFDMTHRLRAMGVQAHIVAEALQPGNKNRLIQAGANVVIRPIRSYPELIVRAIISPGSEMVIEELISHKGATCRRYNVTLNARWNELQQLFSMRGWGILIGYIDKKNQQHIGDSNGTELEIYGLLAIVRENEVPSPQKILAELKEQYL